MSRLSIDVLPDHSLEAGKSLSITCPRAGLAFLFTLSLALRLLWWSVGPQVIESEGLYYARVAENLAQGRGYQGVRENGYQLLYPPLYPGSIALGYLCGLSSETAGRLVSFLFGVPFPIVVCLLARRLYGPAAGWASGLLAAVHPVLVVLSAAVLSESVYLTLLALALYYSSEVFSLGSRRATILAGVCLGLSYLCRPEAFLLTMVLSILTAAVHARHGSLAIARAALLLGVFLVLALPYIVFLSLHTGQVRYEAKTPDAIAYLLREDAGQDGGQIYYGIDRNLEGTGLSMISNLEMIKTARPASGQFIRLLLKQVRRNLSALNQRIAAPYLGQPFLGMLAALGCFASAWGYERLRGELPGLLVCGATLLSVLLWPYAHDRFLLPALPVLLLWAGKGLEVVRTWTLGTEVECGLGGRLASVLASSMVTIWFTLLCGVAASGVRTSDELSQSWSARLIDDKPVGQWLRPQAGRETRIMDTGPTIAYYSGACLVPYPWADSDTALRYIAKQRIDYLILRSSDQKRRPYLEEWNQFPPVDHVELVNTFEGRSGVVRVYRWRAGRQEASKSSSPGIIIRPVPNMAQPAIAGA